MKTVFLNAAVLEIVKVRVLQDMHQGGRAMIMMIMMSYVAGDDDTYYEKTESERTLLGLGGRTSCGPCLKHRH